MQMETVLVFAAATGRTLVLPPDQPMYLLDKGKGHQKAHSFADFFPFELIKQRVPVMEMHEFMAKEAVTGHLISKITGRVQLPPGNKTEFIGTERDDRLKMWGYLRNVTYAPLLRCMKEFIVIPPAPGVNVSLLPGGSPNMHSIHTHFECAYTTSKLHYSLNFPSFKRQCELSSLNSAMT